MRRVTTKKASEVPRRTLYARLPDAVYKKLQKLAALRSAKQGMRVTLQDTIIDLIKAASP
jgi:hypothetical protein